MVDRTEKNWRDLDFDKVVLDLHKPGGGNWSWGCGGSPLADHEWSISHIASEDLHETRYKMPDCISEMLHLRKEHGKIEIQQNFKSLLDM